jgi:subtilisin family serine protease
MWFKVICLSLIVSSAYAVKPIRVAVVDSGFDVSADYTGEQFTKEGLVQPKLCQEGPYDFTGGIFRIQGEKAKVMTDTLGHGTHVTGLIAKNAGTIPYCIIPMKFYDRKIFWNDTQEATTRAFQKALDLKVDIINYSGGGIVPDIHECEILKRALDVGIVVVAAAGNEQTDLAKQKFYPASCDPRIIVVGNVDSNGKPSTQSNWDSQGGVESEVGSNITSLLPGSTIGQMSGSSQSAAIMTGKLIGRVFLMKNDKYLKILKKKADLAPKKSP